MSLALGTTPLCSHPAAAKLLRRRNIVGERGCPVGVSFLVLNSAGEKVDPGVLIIDL